MKTCVACFRKWEQRGAPDFAEFCDDCFAKVQRGQCPAGHQHGTFLAPAGLWAEWPVVVCRQGYQREPKPFSEAHPEVRRAEVLAVLSASEDPHANCPPGAAHWTTCAIEAGVDR